MAQRNRITEELKEEIRRAAAGGETKESVGLRLSMSHHTVTKYWPTMLDGGEADQQSGLPERNYEESGDQAVLRLHTNEPVKTLDDAVRVAKVDLTIWQVDRWECSQWTVPLKIEQGQNEVGRWQPGIAVQTQQYRVKIHLKRILPKSLQQATDALFERMAKHAPKYAALPKIQKIRGEPFLAVLGLFDAHFGKLCWAAETGSAYDLKMAEKLYANAVEDLMAEASLRSVERWVLPVGNDFFHIDNQKNTTYRGTPVDTDGRYAKVIETGETSVILAVEKLMLTAPVTILWVPGNHDPTTSFHLARTLSAWFRKCDRVTVDCGPQPRKYLHWHSTLLGFVHGDEEKPEELPSVMPTERPAEWAGSTCREWLIGHHHRERKWVSKPTDTHQGVTVRSLMSLSGRDAWHNRRSYFSRQAAEVYYYERKRGYAGHAIVSARE